MMSFCPACDKLGRCSKLKFFNINLEESVLLCSDNSCSFPFGYEDLKYSSIAENTSKDSQNDINIDFDLSLFDTLLNSNNCKMKSPKLNASANENNSLLSQELAEIDSIIASKNINSPDMNDTDPQKNNICDINTNFNNEELSKLESEIIADIFSLPCEENSSLANSIIGTNFESDSNDCFPIKMSSENDSVSKANPNKATHKKVSRFPKFSFNEECDINSDKSDSNKNLISSDTNCDISNILDDLLDESKTNSNSAFFDNILSDVSTHNS